MNIPEGVPSRSELHSLLVNELNPIGVAAMKDVMMVVLDDTVDEAIELGFQAANTELKTAFFRLLAMSLYNMIHKGNLDSMLMKSFERFFYSEVFHRRSNEKGLHASIPGTKPR